MIQNQRQGLAIPYHRLRVENAIFFVAAFGKRRILRLSPRHISLLYVRAGPLGLSVDKRIWCFSPLAHKPPPDGKLTIAVTGASSRSGARPARICQRTGDASR